MNWRLASRLSVIVMALLVIVFVIFLQDIEQRFRGSFAAGGQSANPSGLQGTNLGSTPAPDFRLTDQSGAPISLSQFKGKPVVLTFLYTHCKDLCPLTAEKLHATMQNLGSDAPKVAVLAVSIDPKGDTTTSALAFSKAHKMEGYWHFLTGTFNALSPIWSNYDVYADTSDQSVNHSFALYVIDKQGRERIFLNNSFTPAELAADLKILLGE